MTPGPNTSRPRQKILIVDDRRENLIALRTVLDGLDAEIVEASNGNDALLATLHHDFALALLDILMPGMDGYELATLLRSDSRTRRLPIIFMTAAYNEEQQIFKGYESGAVDYLVKPYNPRVLRSKVNVFIEMHSVMDQLQAANREIQQINTELEQRVAERTAELERSNQELDDFAYVASHDLKEPLRGIHNYANFLIEDHAGVLPEDGQDKLRTLTRLATRMEQLINDLLYYSRVGRWEPKPSLVDMNAVLDEVREALGARLMETGGRIECPRPLLPVCSDRTRIPEIFQNLISNALKYNDSTDKSVEVGWLDAPEQSGHPVLPGQRVYYVRDNGIGIRANHIDSVFRIFKRLHARDQYGGGSGAGLTITRKILRRLGGDIWVESEYGVGSTFYFTLPDLPREDGNEAP